MNTVQLPPLPPAGPPVGPPVEPQAGPPRKSHRTAIHVTAIIAGALVVLGAIGALAGHTSGHVTAKAAATATQAPKANTLKATAPKATTPKATAAPKPVPKATAKPQPVATVTVTTTAPPPAATQPAAPPADTILAKLYGTGSGNTGTFTVPADGNWHLSWAYTNGTLFAGQAENFQVYEYGTDGTLDNVLVNALGVGNGQPTADPVYSDSLAGSQAYFQVVTDDASWELVVVSGTSLRES
jgi:hypothetical protein